MAENNEKIPEASVADNKKEEKKANKKPNIFVRIGRRIKKFFKDYISELKKVVWLSKSDVRKNSAIVIVSVVVCAVAILIVDTAFQSLFTFIAGLV